VAWRDVSYNMIGLPTHNIAEMSAYHGLLLDIISCDIYLSLSPCLALT